MLKAIKILSGIDEVVLGVTLLAVGNSLGDFFALKAISK